MRPAGMAEVSILQEQKSTDRDVPTAVFLNSLITERSAVLVRRIALSHPCDRDVPTSCRQKKRRFLGRR